MPDELITLERTTLNPLNKLLVDVYSKLWNSNIFDSQKAFLDFERYYLQRKEILSETKEYFSCLPKDANLKPRIPSPLIEIDKVRRILFLTKDFSEKKDLLTYLLENPSKESINVLLDIFESSRHRPTILHIKELLLKNWLSFALDLRIQITSRVYSRFSPIFETILDACQIEKDKHLLGWTVTNYLNFGFNWVPNERRLAKMGDDNISAQPGELEALFTLGTALGIKELINFTEY